MPDFPDVLPERWISVERLCGDAALRAAGQAVKQRLAAACEAGMILPCGSVDDVVRLAQVCAGDALIAAIEVSERQP